MTHSSTESIRKVYGFGSELTCSSDFAVLGEVVGEAWCTMWRTLVMLITVSIVSSWCCTEKIKRLLLFFSHWFR